MSNPISNHITQYKLPLTPYRLQSYKTPTNAKMKSLDHIAWFKRHIEKNAYQRYYANAVFQIRTCPTYSSQQRYVQPHLKSHYMIQIINNTISPSVIQIADQRKMKSLDHIAWFKRHIEKNAYQCYYANAVFQIRISPTYSSQQRTVHLHHISHYIKHNATDCLLPYDIQNA
jgi:acyl-CoA thioesterase